MKKIISVVFAASTLLVVGCGGGGGGSDPAVPTDEGIGLPVTDDARTALDGTWNVTSVSTTTDPAVELVGNGYFIINDGNYIDMFNSVEDTCDTHVQFQMTVNVIDGPVIDGGLSGEDVISVQSTLSNDDQSLRLDFFDPDTGAITYTIESDYLMAYELGDVATLTDEVAAQLSCEPVVESIAGVYDLSGYESYESTFTNNPPFGGRAFVYENGDENQINAYMKLDTDQVNCILLDFSWNSNDMEATFKDSSRPFDDVLRSITLDGGSTTGVLTTTLYEDSSHQNLRDLFQYVYVATVGETTESDYVATNCPNL